MNPLSYWVKKKGKPSPDFFFTADRPEELSSPQIVGGTFTFRSLGPSTTYKSLTTILKLSIYTYMSLILEQHLLSNLCVTLQYPKPAPPPLPLSTPLMHSITLSSASPPRKSRPIRSSTGLWSFLSKKTEGIIHRVTGGINPDGADGAIPRTSSVDLGSVFASSSKPSRRTQEIAEQTHTVADPASATSHTIKASHDARRGVGVGGVGGGVVEEEEEERQDRENFGPFASTVRRVRDRRRCVLSTSPNVVFPLPVLVARLAKREEEQRGRQPWFDSLESSVEGSIASPTAFLPGSGSGSVSGSGSGSGSASASASAFASASASASGSVHGPPTLRLTGVEKTGLGSVLGWEGQEARGRGMAGVRSFVRHQGLVVLYAVYKPVVGGEMRVCGRPRWVTVRYWARKDAVDAESDQTVGEFVERVCRGVGGTTGTGTGTGAASASATETGGERCETEGCDVPRSVHCVSWACGGVRVRATVKEDADAAEGGDDGDDDDDVRIRIWQTCAVCGRMTERVEMDCGT